MQRLVPVPVWFRFCFFFRAEILHTDACVVRARIAIKREQKRNERKTGKRLVRGDIESCRLLFGAPL